MSFSSDQALLSNQLSVSPNLEPDKPEFRGLLNLTIKRIIDSVNTKEGSLYLLQEIATFKQVYNLNTTSDVYTLSLNRNVYRRTWDIIQENGGIPVPNGNTVSAAHGITSLKDAILIYASVTTDAAGNPRFTITGKDVFINDTNFSFTNNTGNNVTQCIMVAEYTKN